LPPRAYGNFVFLIPHVRFSLSVLFGQLANKLLIKLVARTLHFSRFVICSTFKENTRVLFLSKKVILPVPSWVTSMFSELNVKNIFFWSSFRIGNIFFENNRQGLEVLLM